jgi:hypothetical protein
MPSAHGAILSFVARVSIDSEESRRAWRRESVVGGACVAQRGWREMAELERTGHPDGSRDDELTGRELIAQPLG